jgi:hypothetical protein
MSRGFSLMLSAPTLVVPVLLITQGLAFRILLQQQDESGMRENRIYKSLLWHLIAE